MKRFLGVWLLYCMVAVLLLPLVITLFCGGFGKNLPKTAQVRLAYPFYLQKMQEEPMDIAQYGIRWKESNV